MTDAKWQSPNCTHLCFVGTPLLSHPRPCLQPLVGDPAPGGAQSATTHIHPKGFRRVDTMTPIFPHKKGLCTRFSTVCCGQRSRKSSLLFRVARPRRCWCPNTSSQSVHFAETFQCVQFVFSLYDTETVLTGLYALISIHHSKEDDCLLLSEHTF